LLLPVVLKVPPKNPIREKGEKESKKERKSKLKTPNVFTFGPSQQGLSMCSHGPPKHWSFSIQDLFRILNEDLRRIF